MGPRPNILECVRASNARGTSQNLIKAGKRAVRRCQRCQILLDQHRNEGWVEVEVKMKGMSEDINLSPQRFVHGRHARHVPQSRTRDDVYGTSKFEK